MKLRYTAAAMTVAAVILPMVAMAQSTTTTSGAQSQIQTLLAQIKALQEQLQSLIKANGGMGALMHGSTTAPKMGGEGEHMNPGQMGKMACIELKRNLGPGSQGDDVKKLQEMLANDTESGFTGTPTGVFGPLTAKAMIKFQTRMGIAPSSNGAVGPMTRGLFERACGKGLGGGMGEDKGGMMGGDKAHGGMISGTISANNGSSVTISNNDGKSVTVNVSASTSIQVWSGTTTPPTAGSTADLVVGAKVAAEGPINTDGSMNAVHIRVGFPKPQMQMMGGSDHMGPPGSGPGPNGMMPLNNGMPGPRHDGDGPQNW